MIFFSISTSARYCSAYSLHVAECDLFPGYYYITYYLLVPESSSQFLILIIPDITLNPFDLCLQVGTVRGPSEIRRRLHGRAVDGGRVHRGEQQQPRVRRWRQQRGPARGRGGGGVGGSVAQAVHAQHCVICECYSLH